MGAGFHVINANLNSVEVGVELGKNVPFFEQVRMSPEIH